MSGIISKIGSGIGSLTARATGLAALGIVGYDAHVIGKLTADTYSQSNEANRLSSAAHNSTYLDSSSTVMNKIKKGIFNFQVENNIFMPFESVLGYFKGVAGYCLDNFVPVVLGIGALLGKGKVLPRISALGLMICGGYKLLTDGLGLGRPDKLNNPYK